MAEEGKIPEDEFKFEEWTDDAEPVLLAQGLGMNAQLHSKMGVDPATVKAGAEVVAMLLRELLAMLGKIDRKVAIAINNFPQERLESPKFACWSGDVLDTPLVISGEGVGLFGAQKKWGSYGTAGVLSYAIAGTKDRVVVMWSVPKGLAYKNWFKMAVIPNTTPTDKVLFKDMYYNRHKLTNGDCAPADKGSAKWTARGYRVEAIMATTGEATLNALIERA